MNEPAQPLDRATAAEYATWFRALADATRIQIVSLLAHIDEGCGVRKTSRLIGVNKNTVVRYSLLAGRHAKDLHDELVAFSPADAGGPVRRKMGLRGQKGKAL